MTREEAAEQIYGLILSADDEEGPCIFSDQIEALETAIEVLEQPEHKKGKWIIEKMNTYDLSYGGTGYEPVYRCSVCERLTESYLRLDEPIMPEDADFPRFCPWCGAELEVPEDV